MQPTNEKCVKDRENGLSRCMNVEIMLKLCLTNNTVCTMAHQQKELVATKVVKTDFDMFADLYCIHMPLFPLGVAFLNHCWEMYKNHNLAR